MKSLIKKRPATTATVEDAKVPSPAEPKPVAQCCAKVAKAVAGCHD